MGLDTVIGIVGTLASFYGAYLSLKSERKAKSYSEIAENAKNEVVKKQKTTDLAGILFEAKKVQKAFSKYGIVKDSKGLKGVNFKEDSIILQDFIFRFNEEREVIGISGEINSNLTYDELNCMLNDFSKSEEEDISSHGNIVRLKIDDIIFKIKKTVDNRNIS